MVVSIDTDVVVILLGHMRDMINNGLKQFYMRVGMGIGTSFIGMVKLFHKIGEPHCQGILGFHAFTGYEL